MRCIHDQNHKYHNKLNEQDTPKGNKTIQIATAHISQVSDQTINKGLAPLSNTVDVAAATTPLSLTVPLSPPVSPQDEFEIVSPQGQSTTKAALPTFSALYEKTEVQQPTEQTSPTSLP